MIGLILFQLKEVSKWGLIQMAPALLLGSCLVLSAMDS